MCRVSRRKVAGVLIGGVSVSGCLDRSGIEYSVHRYDPHWSGGVVVGRVIDGALAFGVNCTGYRRPEEFDDFAGVYAVLSWRSESEVVGVEQFEVLQSTGRV